MLISPPFLPPRSTSQGDAAYLSSAMQTADHGYFPVSNKLGWHGGLHLQAPVRGNGREPVRAIADGVVSYVRSPAVRPTGTEEVDRHALGYLGWTDDGCIVIRHDTTIGTQGDTETQVCFYSIYMHLREIRSANVVQGQRIYRKTELGAAGSFEGQANLIHFEIICDDDNLKQLIGRNTGDLSVAADGRTDAVFGELYFKLPASAQVYPERPALNLATGVNGTALGEELFVGIRYGGGDAVVSTYRISGALLESALSEDDAEYNLYRDAGRIVQAFRTAQAPQVPSHSAVYELLRFGRTLGPDALVPADTPHWRKITTPTGQGWVNLNATGVTKHSDADAPHWAGWKLLEDYKKDDSRCDVDSIRAALDENWDSNTTEAESRLNNTDVRRSLSRLICKFPSEWQRNGVETRWNWLTKEGPNSASSKAPTLAGSTYLSQANFPMFQRYVETLAFWESAALEGIEAAHWHFHPVKFIEHFRKCGWLSLNEMNKIYRDKESIYTGALQSSEAVKERYRLSLNIVFRKYLLNNALRMSHFFGQTAQESYYFMLVRESSVGVAIAIRNNHISIQNEENGYLQITDENRAQLRYFSEPGQGGYYEGRTTLGNTDPGDGIKFRGRGMKQLTGRYNYSEYWVFRGWLDRNSYDASWFKNNRPGPAIDNPQIAADIPYNAVDTAGFYCAKNVIHKASDNGVTAQASAEVSRIVNPYESPAAPRRASETISSYRELGDEV